MKLFPALAFCFGVEFASEEVWKEYNSVTASIDRGDVSTLPMLHIRSCCLKVIVSSCSAEFVDILRRACGGHGFMMSSCFPKLYGQTTAACTYEGDNTVLLLQVARGILKPSFKWSKPVTGSLFIPAEKKVNLASVPGIFTTVARNRVEACQIELDQLQKSGLSTDAAWNSMGMRLIAAAESYGRQVVMDSFVAKLFTASVSPEILRVLKSLCRLLATSWIRRYSGEFITYGGLTAVDIQLIDECLEAELKEIRPNAVGIVDAFDFRDEILNSALGCYDGNVYERLLETAKKSPLNKKDVPDAFEKYLKPLMMQSKL
ncbi:unnamed protein product [Notodromas monacha]|uniref:Acyl-CoA oxidase C-terminal domain-containing protein n=1 Tax=Notodromas monacha TaxID=399045 RepID=A0A7R9BRA0_9CRUS|nr:unnamed protein product [Notodromas monacha]CAG0919316.1 unnamed protein product [Notodromas monacha]